MRIAQFHLFNALSIMRNFFILLAFMLSTTFLSAQIIIGPPGGGTSGPPTYDEGFRIGCALAGQHARPGSTWNQVFFDQNYNPIVYNTYNDARDRGWALYALGVREGFQHCYPRPTPVGGLNGSDCNPVWGTPCPPEPPVGCPPPYRDC